MAEFIEILIESDWDEDYLMGFEAEFIINNDTKYKTDVDAIKYVSGLKKLLACMCYMINFI